MMTFLKKYYFVFFILGFIGIYIYNQQFKQKYRTLYKSQGFYAKSKVIGIKKFGRGGGYDILYTFKVNGKEYKSVNSKGHISYSQAQEYIDKFFLVVYLNNDVHNNRLYTTIPIQENINEDNLKKWVADNPNTKDKLDSIPPSGFFWQNYF
jgi:hypothetical protein